MAFVQITEFRTPTIELARRISEQRRQATEGKRTVRREPLARDCSDPSRYLAIAFFGSNEPAMENASLPETRAAAALHGQTSKGPPVFDNPDIFEGRP